jgi:tetratricopeptide (TPR) repeat protein
VQALKTFAKIAVAAAFGDWKGVVSTVADSGIDMITKWFAEKSAFDRVVAKVEQGLQTLVSGEGIQPDAVPPAIANAEVILRDQGLNAAQLMSEGLVAARAANIVLERSEDQLNRLGAHVGPLCRKIIIRFYEEFLNDPEALRQLDAAFRRALLQSLSDLSKAVAMLPAETAQAIRSSAAAALLDDRIERWRKDRFSYTELLRAEYGIVPFYGRDDVRANLAGWCDEARPIGVRLYTGQGGMGKTRLFIELSRDRRRQGWCASFLSSAAAKAPPDAIAALMEFERPALVVIDYAETRQDEVVAILRAAARASDDRRIRIVLVARSAEDWWTKLQQEGDGVGGLLRGPATERFELPALALMPEHRTDIFDAAAKAFAAHLSDPAPIAERPDLTKPHFDAVLFIHISALAAVMGERIESADDLLDFILGRERHLWREAARAMQIEEKLDAAVAEAAALMTLVGGAESWGEAQELLSSAPLLSDQSKADRLAIASLLRQFYGVSSIEGRGWLAPVMPDLLGERLVAQEVARETRLLYAATRSGLRAGRVERALTVLTRVAQRHPLAVAWLQSVLASDPVRLADAAVSVAIGTGDPIGQAFADVLAQSQDVGIARRLDGQIPQPTVALRELGAVALQICYDELRKIPGPLPDPTRTELARTARRLALRLSALGRHDDALPAAQEAVDILRPLAARPEFQPDLALSLDALGESLRRLGRREDAVAAVREAVALGRPLAAARPDAFPDLAISLNNLAVLLGELGRHDEALPAAQEAVDYCRALVAVRPDEFRPGLGLSCNTLALSLRELGRHDDALAAVQEGADHYRALAAARPDAFRPDLATSLNNLAVFLIELGRYKDALAVAQEAVDIRRPLAAARPDAFRPDLASSLHAVAHSLSELGRPKDALAAVQEAVNYYRMLAAARPDAFRADLAFSLNTLTVLLTDLARHEDALAAAQESADTARPLASARPDVFGPLLYYLAELLSESGRHKDALAAVQEADDLYRTLAAAQPEPSGGLTAARRR